MYVGQEGQHRVASEALEDIATGDLPKWGRGRAVFLQSGF